MKEVNYVKVKKLRSQGLSFGKIAHILGIPKGTAYRIWKRGKEGNPTYKEKVGNKKNKKMLPIWEHVDPVFLYRYIYKICWVFFDDVNEVEEAIDFLLNFAYTLDLSDKDDPVAYLKTALRRKRYDLLKRAWFKSSIPLEKAGLEDPKGYE